MNFLRQSKIPLGILLIAGVCFIGLLAFSGVFGRIGNLPVTGGLNQPGNTNQGAFIGEAFSVSELDNQGCPVGAGNTTRYYSDDPIYVGFERSQIPAGTSVFARLLREGQGVEDSPEIVADRPMNTCVWFEFSPSVRSGGFEPGSYQTELFVNGNLIDQVQFEVSRRGGQPNVSGGNAELWGVRLGDGSTTTQIDQNGCPLYANNTFNTRDTIYMSFENSFIPAGTSMFARLSFRGSPVEDTDEIYSERDMRSCFWFMFDPGQGRFTQGDYSVTLYINGSPSVEMPVYVRE
jgi:hypothetical protein